MHLRKRFTTALRQVLVQAYSAVLFTKCVRLIVIKLSDATSPLKFKEKIIFYSTFS